MEFQITNNAKRHHSIEKRYFTVCMHAVVFDTFDSATRIVLCLNGCSQIKWSTSNTTLHSLSWRFPHAVYKLFLSLLDNLNRSSAKFVYNLVTDRIEARVVWPLDCLEPTLLEFMAPKMSFFI